MAVPSVTALRARFRANKPSLSRAVRLAASILHASHGGSYNQGTSCIFCVQQAKALEKAGLLVQDPDGIKEDFDVPV